MPTDYHASHQPPQCNQPLCRHGVPSHCHGFALIPRKVREH